MDPETVTVAGVSLKSVSLQAGRPVFDHNGSNACAKSQCGCDLHLDQCGGDALKWCDLESGSPMDAALEINAAGAIVARWL